MGGGGRDGRKGGRGGKGYGKQGDDSRYHGQEHGKGGYDNRRGRPPPSMSEGPGADGGDAGSLGLRHPITPLGLPDTPPPLPALPAVFAREEPSAANEEPRPKRGEDYGGTGGDWTPVEKLMEKADRRTFFHTAGKSHAFKDSKDGRKYGNPQEECEVGALVELQVAEVHFGQPRVGMRGDPEIMGKMIKWPAEQFDEYTLECAQISFGNDYWVWSAANIRSNRILYAMKRVGVHVLKATCVPPPPLPEPEEDIDLTYGASIQGIQLVP